MDLKNTIKGLFVYQGPKEYDRFELLEDEAEDRRELKSNCESENASQETVEAKPEGKLRKKISGWLQGASDDKSQKKNTDGAKVNKKLQVNLQNVKSEFHAPTNQDVVIRKFKVLQQSNAFIVYIDGMADNNTINDYILRQLLERHSPEVTIETQMVDYVSDNLLATNQIVKEAELKEIIKQILNGLTALFIEGCDQCILIESRGFEKRSVSPPLTETVVRGPQEAFIENLRTNITLVRRIIRNKNLVTEMLPVGTTNNMTCGILYMKEIANPEIVKEAKRRINSIDIDFVSAEGILEELIEDHPFSILPQALSTERPDRTASFLMEGKVAIICDGTPFACIVPVTFFHMLHTSEDYSLRWQFGTFLRILRLIACILAVFLPGLYVALTLYHQEMIPTELLVSLTEARVNVPFPVFVELLLMELSWELIREAGVRVPSVVGQTLGIIGAIILGQAAVAAGLVSPILIIVVAIAGMGNFAIPNYDLSFGIRILRFVFIFLGAMAGFYGIAVGIFIFSGLACSMKSFGEPYFSPVAPKTRASTDLTLRMPIWMQKMRPDALNPRNRQRSGKIIRGWTEERKGTDDND
jgi:spore germination protein KA